MMKFVLEDIIEPVSVQFVTYHYQDGIQTKKKYHQIPDKNMLLLSQTIILKKPVPLFQGMLVKLGVAQGT